MPMTVYPRTFALWTSSEGISSPSLKVVCVCRSIIALVIDCLLILRLAFLESLELLDSLSAHHNLIYAVNRRSEFLDHIFHAIIIDILALDCGLDRLGLLVHLVEAQVDACDTVELGESCCQIQNCGHVRLQDIQNLAPNNCIHVTKSLVHLSIAFPLKQIRSSSLFVLRLYCRGNPLQDC